MRIIHSRKRVFEFGDNAFCNKCVLLSWVLSIIKWKILGHQIVLYTDKSTLNDINKFGFSNLYDEINTDLFENGDVCKDIDFKWFWATPKLLSYHYELEHLGNNPIVCDMDVVPARDFSNLFNIANVTVWSNKEFVNVRAVYPQLYELSTPKGYTFPKWFTGEAKPLNTGIIYFNNPEFAKEYLDEAMRFIRGNVNSKNNSDVITMCNAEQRMLGEYVAYKNLTYTTVQPFGARLSNRNGFHIHGFKNLLTSKEDINWHLQMLLEIKKYNERIFNKLLKHELFEEEKKHFEENGYVYEEVEILSRCGIGGKK